MKKLHTGLTSTLVVTILLTGYLSFAVMTNAKSIQDYNVLGWIYLYLFILLPLIGVLFAGLAIYLIKSQGIQGLRNLRWDFSLLTLLVIMFLLTGQVNRFFAFTDKFVISVHNKTAYPIEILKIYGRHDLIESRNLPRDKRTFLEFRGCKIDRSSKNYLENRILLDYYTNKSWNSIPIIDTWRVVTWDTLHLTFYSSDSVTVK